MKKINIKHYTQIWSPTPSPQSPTPILRTTALLLFTFYLFTCMACAGTGSSRALPSFFSMVYNQTI